MHDDIRRIMAQIGTLEKELSQRLHQQREGIGYRVDGRRIEFSDEVRAAHQRSRTRLLSWVAASSWRNAVSTPVVCALILPFGFLDLCLAVYQAVCFRLYRIERVRRSDYIPFDRHKLGYLNLPQKLICVYCGYANGLIAYTREIASRTEQYWCPIKHARRMAGAHPRYPRFLDYGDAEELPVKLQELRTDVQQPPADGGEAS